LAVDTTQATSTNRIKIYVNGTQQTDFIASTYPSQNTDMMTNNNVASYLGREVNGGQYFDGYLAEVNFIDGTALDPTSFGETKSGIWVPKAYSGAYGTNGFYLSFADSAAIGDDLSGNGNDWTANNLVATVVLDVLLDSPTQNWCVHWLAGNGTASNTDGSITSTVSVNQKAGFSVVSYTGTRTSAGNDTIGHGLGKAPSVVISKARNATGRWVFQHSSLGADDYLELNTTSASADSVSAGAGSLPKPTSSVFYGSYLFGLNVNGENCIAYCFAEVEGYSKFGSYTGNGSTDGPFVYCGFRPAFVMVKRSDG
jgi:hypothetical protein